MPELTLFRRRWHTATDALPLLMVLLCVFHLLWFVPYATGAYSIEGTGLKYECAHATELRVANYSLFATFGLAAINEAVLTVLGLRGGPFETRKRRFMNPLLYLEIVLWGLLLAFTIYATVTVYSPAVADSCWSNNPCQYNPDLFPLACRDQQGTGTIRSLPQTCQKLLEAGPNFMYCWLTWLANGANWAGAVVYDIVVFFKLLEEDGFHGIDINPAGNVEFTSNVTTRIVAGWFVCFIRSRTSDSDAVLDNLLATAGSTEDDSEGVDFIREYADDPDLNCTGVLERWNSRQMFSQCNSTNDPVFWNQTLGIELDVSAGAVEGEDGSVQYGIPGFTTVSEYNAFLREYPNLFQLYNQFFLEAIRQTGILDIGIGGNFNLSKASDTPWFSCMNATCQEQTYWAEDCQEWAQILALPQTKNSKPFFEILVITSWTVLAITALVLFLCFNAFPDYNDVDSWEGTLRSIDRMCLCGGGLAGSANVSGSDMSVSREIAQLLNLLFGGIDMDPTDRLLGVYLVSERQHRRRQHDVLAALQKAGIVAEQKRKRAGRFVDALSKLNPKRSSGSKQQQPGSPAAAALPSHPETTDKGSAASADGAEPPLAVTLNGRNAGDSSGSGPGRPRLAAEVPAAAAAAAADGKLLASPFDVPAAPAASPPTQLGQPPRSSDPRLLMYQHSMVRLQSRVARGISAGSPSAEDSAAEDLAAAEAGRAVGGEQAAGVAEAEPEQVLEGPADSSSTQQSGQNQAAAQQSTAVFQKSAVGVVPSFHPLLTPSGCAAAGKLSGPPVSPQEAAEIYAGKLDPVDHGTLRQAQRISRFAVAAYGLQGVIWAKGQRPTMCLAIANRLVKCFKRPLGLENKFRKHNFDTILQMTGVAPADLLYVNYTNVAGGVLPYLLMLHRPSKSVVLSVRGTVSMEDMITDLLSNPVDVADWVPEWVREEARLRRAASTAGDASGDGLKAHIGIVSSATAILKDLEERGLLRDMLLPKLLRAATLAGRDSQAVIAEFLAGHKGGEIPELPARPASMQRRGPQLSGDPLAAAAAGSGIGAPSGGEEEDAQFAEAEERHLSRLRRLDEGREVELPLKRAQTIIRSKLRLQGWKVVVTGHSLGAAVATLLGMQLRERFADLECWAFNPPGGLLSWELSHIARCYCTSVVVGKDVISRLSFTTSKRVVDEMVVSLARCKRPKLKVLLDVALGRRKRAASTPHTFCKFEEVGPEALQLVEQYYRASHLHMQGADTTEMYPPGKLVFMRPFKGKKKKQTVWDAVWIDAATLISEGILVTPTMMAHHRLFVLAEAFESIFAGEVATDAAAPDEQAEEEDLMFL